MPELYNTMGQEISWHSKNLNSLGGENLISKWQNELGLGRTEGHGNLWSEHLKWTSGVREAS